MREQDAGAACIPVSVLRRHRYFVWSHGGWHCICGERLETGPITSDGEICWYAHLAALAPVQGTAATLTPEELGSLQSAVGACVDAGEDYLPTQRALGQMLDKYYARALAQGTAPRLSGQLRRSFEAMERGEQPESWESLQAKAQGTADETTTCVNCGRLTKECQGHCFDGCCGESERDFQVPATWAEHASVVREFLEKIKWQADTGFNLREREMRVQSRDALKSLDYLTQQATAGALPAAVVALLRDYWYDLSDQENSGTQDWRRDRLKRISALLAGQPDAATSEPDFSRYDPALE